MKNNKSTVVRLLYIETIMKLGMFVIKIRILNQNAHLFSRHKKIFDKEK